MGISKQRIERHVHGADSSDNPFSELPLRRFKKDETEIVVRFLSDPVDNPYWLETWTVWTDEGKPVLTVEAADENVKYLPPKDTPGYRVSTRVLANAMEVDNGELVVLEMPITLARQVFTRFELKGTVTDRDFSLVKMGKGMNTSYSAVPESPESRKAQVSRLQPIDLEEWAQQLTVPEDWPFGQLPPKKQTVKQRLARATGARHQDPDELEPEDPFIPEDDDEPGQGGEEPVYTEADLKGLPLKELRRICVEEFGVDPQEAQKWTAGACREFLTGGSF